MGSYTDGYASNPSNDIAWKCSRCNHIWMKEVDGKMVCSNCGTPAFGGK